MNKGTCIVAIGGNAILTEYNEGTIKEQVENISVACKKIVELVKEGYKVVLTHGNGPQVGQTLLRHKISSHTVSEGTLDTCGAETQGLLGYLIQQGLRNHLAQAGINAEVVSLVTQVLVDKDDSAFKNPTKPIGPFYSEEEACRLSREYNKHIIEDSGRGYRIVVPSPQPVDIVEKNTIEALVESGAIVIAAGGGGIPVVKVDDQLVGVEAVIDKDFASSVLASMIKADYLLLLTGVDKVCVNFRKPDERQLDQMSITEAASYLAEGQFPEGSMAPKVRAAISFVKNGGQKALITTLDNMELALAGKAGTAVSM